MSAVLLPSGYAETVGKPCPTCGGIGKGPVNQHGEWWNCSDCIEGVVRERYVVAKAKREVYQRDLDEWWPATNENYWPSIHPSLTRVVPVEPLGETDWYIATEQWRVFVGVESETGAGWSTWVTGVLTETELDNMDWAMEVERRFAITHVAHNVRELRVVAVDDADDIKVDEDILVIEDDGSVWLWMGVDYWGEAQEQNVTDEPWASDLAPGDLVLEFTEPPVLLDEPIVEMTCCRHAGDYWHPRDCGGPGVEPLVLALGVNRIGLP